MIIVYYQFHRSISTRIEVYKEESFVQWIMKGDKNKDPDIVELSNNHTQKET